MSKRPLAVGAKLLSHPSCWTMVFGSSKVRSEDAWNNRPRRYHRSMPANRNVRLKDVAAIAGVSLATASKALTGSDRVSPETKARVREIAERLDFRPDALARSFALGQSRTIGIMTRRVASTFATPVLVGAVLGFGERDLATLAYDADIQDPHGLIVNARELLARRIDGLLIIGNGHDFVTPSVSRHFAAPVAYAFHATDNPEDVMFLPDNEAAGRMATQHLLDRGRTRIAHLTASAEGIAVQRRQLGMAKALDEAGMQAVAIRHGQWTRRSGAASFSELLDAGVHVDAVFCGNDHIGLGVLDVCEARGIRVPDDIAVIGVDNWEGLILNDPDRQLTSIDPELRTLGRIAAHELLAPDPAPGERLIAPTLVQGPST